jgi:hypothetical protein
MRHKMHSREHSWALRLVEGDSDTARVGFSYASLSPQEHVHATTAALPIQWSIGCSVVLKHVCVVDGSPINPLILCIRSFWTVVRPSLRY